ncbi:MAG: hypothetical protein IPM64_17475 [Phycisphaerales bacterium]|nr:hypothetical protein [Phycisphaerales bacterium]
MTVRTNVQSLKGAALALSATRPATFDAAGYSDTDIAWSTIGEVENYGNHGMQAQIITFTNVADAVVQKLKGSKDYGTMALTIGHVPGDAGQALAATASESQNRYSARITYPLGDGEVTQEIHYLDVLVASREFQDGEVNSVRKLAVALAICKQPVEVAAT